MIDGLAGIIIWTEDVEKLSSFYLDVLGMTPHSKRTKFVAFRWGDVRLSIGQHELIYGANTEPYRIMINLGTKDIDRTYHTLLGKGVTFLRPPEHETWGGQIATFLDPDGNILQLLQQPR